MARGRDGARLAGRVRAARPAEATILSARAAAGRDRLGRQLIGVLAAVVLVAAGLGAPARADAWTNGACPTAGGVTVVVDFSALGGGVAIRCVPGQPASGFAALTGAGFTIEQVRNVPGFLCRIDGLPAPARETCVNTPPTTAYWSYWTAQRGGIWSYVSSGAGTRTPPPGSVEGWAFVDGPGGAQPPSVAPPAPPPPATPRPTPDPTPLPDPPTPRPVTPTPGQAPGSSRAVAVSPSPGAATARASAEPSPTVGVSGRPASPTPTAEASGTARPMASPDPAGRTRSPDGGVTVMAETGARPAEAASRVPAGTVVGAAVVLGVAGAATLAARRRSAREDG